MKFWWPHQIHMKRKIDKPILRFAIIHRIYRTLRIGLHVALANAHIIRVLYVCVSWCDVSWASAIRLPGTGLCKYRFMQCKQWEPKNLGRIQAAIGFSTTSVSPALIVSFATRKLPLSGDMRSSIFRLAPFSDLCSPPIKSGSTGKLKINWMNLKRKWLAKYRTSIREYLPSLRVVMGAVVGLCWITSSSRFSWLNSLERPLPSNMLLAKFKQIWVLHLSPLTELNVCKRNKWMKESVREQWGDKNTGDKNISEGKTHCRPQHRQLRSVAIIRDKRLNSIYLRKVFSVVYLPHRNTP